jgi:predicted amidohydrolase
MLNMAENEVVRLYLAQENYPLDISGQRLFSGPLDEPSDQHLEEMGKILGGIPENSNFAVISEHPGAHRLLDKAQQSALERIQIIVLPLGRVREENGDLSSTVAVLGIDQEPHLLRKISLSVEDQEKRLVRGEDLIIFDLPKIKFAVLNCHDYTHADLIVKLAEAQVELLVVTSFNPASDLYAQFALADAHRLFCFIALSNVGNLGGSGVFGPFRRKGRKNSEGAWERALSVGGKLFYADGASAARVEVELPIGELRRARAIFRQPGIVDKKKEEFLRYDPIIPAESFLRPGEAQFRDAIKEIRNRFQCLLGRGYPFWTADRPRRILQPRRVCHGPRPGTPSPYTSLRLGNMALGRAVRLSKSA